jgi:methyl-accepting chemotaxis protein
LGDAYSITQILWSTDPMTQRAIGMVLGLALISAAAIFIPLTVRLIRLFMFERRLRNWVDFSASAPADKITAETLGSASGPDHEELGALFANSPISASYEEFERRWTTAELAEGINRAPIRMMDVFDEKPLLPFGPRRSLLPVMPGLFLGVGVFAALVGLIPSLGNVAADTLSGDARSTLMATQLGLALRASAWGFICAISATLSGRLIEGAFDARSQALDEIVEHAFGSVSPGELAEITRQTQQKSLETLGKELSQFANELNERLDRGLQRIEQSTARSANLVSQEQRGALHTIVQELSLSVRQGVEHHLSELRGALQRAVEHQTSVTAGLAETFERMVENSNLQDRVARTLSDSAQSVEAAANSMRGSATEMKPILDHLSSTSRGLADTAERIGDTQEVVARTAEGVRSSLEYAAAGVDDQRQFIEVSLGEIRRSLVGLGDGLGDSLQRSLREVDDVLGGTIGQLRMTLADSNETIERLAGPIRAAEGTTRETHVALDRVRGEVEALGQWLNQAVKPLRSGLSEVGGRAEEIARTMIDFTSHTRQIDKTMESLREEIHEESRRLQGTGSELSRRLKLASDTVGLLEGGSADSPRRSRSEWTSTPLTSLTSSTKPTPRERSWSPASQPRGNESRHSPSSEFFEDSDADSGTTSTAYMNGSSRPEGVEASGLNRTEDGLDTDAARDSAGRELASSGYRVGVARAQGPDPYARSENDHEAPSNVRHFPTHDRELGDDLKLSGLLGPSTRDDSNSESVPSNSSGKTSNNQSDEHGTADRSSDDSE